MDPIEQIFKQAGFSGPSSAIAAGQAFTQSFLHARDSKRQDRQLALQERQQSSNEEYQRANIGFANRREARADIAQGQQTEQYTYEKTLRPMLDESRQLGLKSQHLDYDLKLMTQRRNLQVQEGESEAMSILVDAGHLGFQHSDIQDRMKSLASRNPAVFGGTEPGKALLMNFKGSAALMQGLGGFGGGGLPGGTAPARVTFGPNGPTVTYENATPHQQQMEAESIANTKLRTQTLNQRIAEFNERIPEHLKLEYNALISGISKMPQNAFDQGALTKAVDQATRDFYKRKGLVFPERGASQPGSTNATPAKPAAATDPHDPLGLFK